MMMAKDSPNEEHQHHHQHFFSKTIVKHFSYTKSLGKKSSKLPLSLLTSQ